MKIVKIIKGHFLVYDLRKVTLPTLIHIPILCHCTLLNAHGVSFALHKYESNSTPTRTTINTRFGTSQAQPLRDLCWWLYVYVYNMNVLDLCVCVCKILYE